MIIYGILIIFTVILKYFWKIILILIMKVHVDNTKYKIIFIITIK